MSYKIVVVTDDGNEYELQKKFRTYKEADDYSAGMFDGSGLGSINDEDIAAVSIEKD